MAKKPREAKPGELREIHILERLEKFSKRPETRMDVQKILSNLSPIGQIYAKHLVMSGPSSILSAARALGLKSSEIEAAIEELERGLASLRF
jgi:hypothetical protein